MKHRYVSERKITTYWRNQYGYDFLIEAVHTPSENNDWKWNIPYYCYLFQKDGNTCYLVTTAEVIDILQEGKDPDWNNVLELYEESSLARLENTSLPDAYFYETYLYLKTFVHSDAC